MAEAVVVVCPMETIKVGKVQLGEAVQRGARVAGVILLLCSMETREMERVLLEQDRVCRGNCLGGWAQEVCRKDLLWRLDSVLKAWDN